jgi:outer membrane protein assembly factor BamA
MVVHYLIIFLLLVDGVLAQQAVPCVEGTPVHAIKLTGLDYTKEIVVLRELRNQAGKPLDLEAWQQEQRALFDLDLFAAIDLECFPDTVSRTDSLGDQNLEAGIILRYRFLEMFQYLPAPSVKQTDQDGWMVGGALAALNLFGYDIRAEVQARGTVSPWLRAKEYAFYASSPYMGKYPVDWKTEVVRADSWDPLRDYHEESWFAEADVLHMTKHGFGGLVTIGGRNLQHVDDSLAWLSGSHHDLVPRLGAAVLWDNRDAAIDTRKGVYQELRFTKVGGPLGGPADYSEWLWDVQGSLPLGPGTARITMLTRYRPGRIGFYDRFHQGGANTLRGFNPDSSIHGNSEILANTEWRHPFVDRRPINLLGIQGFWGLQGVVGADYAWLWDGDSLPGWSDYRTSIYAGLHLLVPALERVRFEIGGNPRDRSWAFTIGLFEKAATQRWRSR